MCGYNTHIVKEGGIPEQEKVVAKKEDFGREF